MIFIFGTLDQPRAELPEGDTSGPLIEKAARGDEHAFGQLVELYEKYVYYTACRVLTTAGCGTSDAEDIAQASFLKAWNTLSSFRGECAFVTWLYRITVNTARDYLRTELRHGALSPLLAPDAEVTDEIRADVPLLSTDEIPEDAAMRKETIRLVREALEEMPPAARRLIVLRDLNELSYEEISSILGIEVNTVKSRLYRARQALKKLLLTKDIF